MRIDTTTLIGGAGVFGVIVFSTWAAALIALLTISHLCLKNYTEFTGETPKAFFKRIYAKLRNKNV